MHTSPHTFNSNNFDISVIHIRLRATDSLFDQAQDQNPTLYISDIR